MKKFRINKIIAAAIVIAGAALAGGCSDTKSYSELLSEEERASNWYLAGFRIENSIPANGEFKTMEEYGKDAPFYKMDSDGYLYMQVVKKGTGAKVQKDDVVYFRFQRKNLLLMYEGYEVSWDGNTSDMNANLQTNFVYANKNLQSYTLYGEGIQKPLEYLPYLSEVNLVLRSYLGFSTDQSQCIPYIINIKYFPAEY